MKKWGEIFLNRTKMIKSKQDIFKKGVDNKKNSEMCFWRSCMKNKLTRKTDHKKKKKNKEFFFKKKKFVIFQKKKTKRHFFKRPKKKIDKRKSRTVNFKQKKPTNQKKNMEHTRQQHDARRKKQEIYHR